MRRLRRLPAALLALPLVLSGCTSEEDDAKARERVEADRDLVREATTDVLPPLTTLTGSELHNGRMSFGVCGGSIPRAAFFESEFQLMGNSMEPEGGVSTLQEELEQLGWEFTPQGNKGVLYGSQGDLTLQVRVFDMGLDVGIKSECVDMSRKQAEELADLPLEEIPQP